MNRQELIEKIATGNDLTKIGAGRILDSILESIVLAVKKGEVVSLVGFGSFKKVSRAARKGFNPGTGVGIKIAARTLPKFTPGLKFRDAVDAKAAKRRAAAK